MDNELKFYLLAETTGWNASTYAYDYRSKLTTSDAYRILSYNILEVKHHLNTEAKKIVEEYSSLKLEPINLRDAFIVQTRVNYLALHSFPEYYLNPLSISPTYSGDVTSIGELMIENENIEMSINDLIFDETITIDRKKEIVQEKVLFYLDEMNQLVYDSTKITTNKAFKNDNKNNAFQLVRDIASQMTFFLSNVFLFFTLICPSIPYWNAFYTLQRDSFLTYISLIFQIMVLLNDIIYIIFHSYKGRISEPFNYAKRFLKKRTKTVLDDIKETADDLYDYIVGAILNKFRLENDIKNFSKLSTSYVDLTEVINVSNLKEKKPYKVLNNLSTAFITITGIILIVTFFSYIFSFIFGANL